MTKNKITPLVLTIHNDENGDTSESINSSSSTATLSPSSMGLNAVLQAKRLARMIKSRAPQPNLVGAKTAGRFREADYFYDPPEKSEQVSKLERRFGGPLTTYAKKHRATIAESKKNNPTAFASMSSKTMQLNRGIRFHETTTSIKSSMRTKFDNFFVNVISVENTYIYYWDWYLTILAIFTIIIVPFNIAFMAGYPNPIVSVLVNLSFIFDITLNFRRAYYDEDRYEVYQPKQIAKRYLYGWFAADFIASFPLELIAIMLQVDQEYAAWFSLNKILRLFRMYRSVEMLITSENGQLIRLLGLFLITGHILGCIFWAIGRMQPVDVIGGRWIDVYIGDQTIAEMPIRFQYTSSIYWAFATLGTVGYGDVAAHSWIERGFVSMTMLLGAALYASIFGSFTSLIERLERGKRAYYERLSEVNNYCRANNIPDFMKKRMVKYHDATFHFEAGTCERVLTGLPPCVQSDMLMFMYAPLVAQVQVFSVIPKRVMELIVKEFKHEVYFCGDYLTRQGDVIGKMFFLAEGVAEVWVSHVKDVSNLDFEEILEKSSLIQERYPGSVFGEKSLVVLEKRASSVVASSDLIRILSLTSEAFASCIDKYYLRDELWDSLRKSTQIRGLHGLRKA